MPTAQETLRSSIAEQRRTVSSLATSV